MGGYRDGEVNTIDFITIATTGNSQDFGDLVNARNGNGGYQMVIEDSYGWLFFSCEN